MTSTNCQKVVEALLMKNQRQRRQWGQRNLLSRSNKDFFSSQAVCLCQLDERHVVVIVVSICVCARRFVYFNALVVLPLCRLDNCSARSTVLVGNVLTCPFSSNQRNYSFRRFFLRLHLRLCATFPFVGKADLCEPMFVVWSQANRHKCYLLSSSD